MLVGIDLGTTNSLCAVYEANGPRLLPNAAGDLLTPSVVAVMVDGQANEYGLTESQAIAYRRNPIDLLEPIAQAGIPLLHIVSLNDEIVPPSENMPLKMLFAW